MRTRVGRLFFSNRSEILVFCVTYASPAAAWCLRRGIVFYFPSSPAADLEFSVSVVLLPDLKTNRPPFWTYWSDSVPFFLDTIACRIYPSFPVLLESLTCDDLMSRCPFLF